MTSGCNCGSGPGRDHPRCRSHTPASFCCFLFPSTEGICPSASTHRGCLCCLLLQPYPFLLQSTLDLHISAPLLPIGFFHTSTLFILARAYVNCDTVIRINADYIQTT